MARYQQPWFAHLRKLVDLAQPSAKQAEPKIPWSRESDVRAFLIAEHLDSILQRQLHLDMHARRSLVFCVAIDIARSGTSQITEVDARAAFLSAYDAIPKAPGRWQVVFPLWIEAPWLDSERVLQGLALEFRRFSINEHPSGGRIRSELDSLREILLPSGSFYHREPLFLQTHVSEPTARQAANAGLTDLARLRAVWTLAHRAGQYTVCWGEGLPLAVCENPPMAAVLNEKGEVTQVFWTRSRGYVLGGGNHIAESVAGEADRLLSDMRVLQKHGRERVLSVLDLYASALDAQSVSDGFLALWQALERSVPVDRNSSHYYDKVCDSVLRLWDYPPYLQEYLHVLRNRRHALVHEGIFDEEQQAARETLRLIVERTLLALVRLCTRFPTASGLKEVWRNLCTERIGEIQERLDAAEFVLKERQLADEAHDNP